MKKANEFKRQVEAFKKHVAKLRASADHPIYQNKPGQELVRSALCTMERSLDVAGTVASMNDPRLKSALKDLKVIETAIANFKALN